MEGPTGTPAVWVQATRLSPHLCFPGEGGERNRSCLVPGHGQIDAHLTAVPAEGISFWAALPGPRHGQADRRGVGTHPRLQTEPREPPPGQREPTASTSCQRLAAVLVRGLRRVTQCDAAARGGSPLSPSRPRGHETVFFLAVPSAPRTAPGSTSKHLMGEWVETVSPSLGPGAGRPRSPLSARGLAQASPAGLLVLPSLWAAPAGQGAPRGSRLLGAFPSPGHSGPVFLLSPPTQPLKGKEGVPGPTWLSGRPCGQGPCADLGKRVQADRWPRQRPRGAAAPGGRSGATLSSGLDPMAPCWLWGELWVPRVAGLPAGP